MSHVPASSNDLLPWPSSHSPLPAPGWVSLSLHQLHGFSWDHILWELNVAHSELAAFVSCGSGQSALHRGCRAHCGNNGLWEQLVISSSREKGVTLILLSPPRKAGYIFQLPEEQCAAVAATWQKRRLLKEKTPAVPFRAAAEMRKLRSPASSPLSWLLCMHAAAFLSSAELQGQEQPLPAALQPSKAPCVNKGRPQCSCLEWHFIY